MPCLQDAPAERTIAPYAAAALLNFSTMFAGLMVLPIILGAPPYNLSAGIIGVTFLPVGVGGFVTSTFGGRLADRAAANSPGFPEARLMPAVLGAMVLMPAVLGAMVLMPCSLLVYGWTLHYRTNLAGPLVGHFFVGVALSLYFPAIFSYLTVIKQQQAGAASAAVQAMMVYYVWGAWYGGGPHPSGDLDGPLHEHSGRACLSSFCCICCYLPQAEEGVRGHS